MFCILRNRAPFTVEESGAGRGARCAIVAPNDPIDKEVLTLEAVAVPRSAATTTAAASAGKPHAQRADPVYAARAIRPLLRLHAAIDGHPQTFRLLPTEGGFVLQYPRQGSPTALQPMKTYTK
ncbi:MAG: hypothetical protein IPK17_05070 [Chloroflexi bacterium]|uniref:hypothetical protein n=1 Tax=Candidatus Flexifilum breve TaxID=3140694 RepID=UPI0031371E57|nr:hypothetical protein [Chloroflexota bacterium]